ncbi:MAG: hypothetical protein ACRD98_09865, partial [Nitrososphaera sp.]
GPSRIDMQGDAPRACEKNRRERWEVSFGRSAGPFRRERNGAHAPKGRVPRMERATGVYIEIHEDSERRRKARARGSYERQPKAGRGRRRPVWRAEDATRDPERSRFIHKLSV